MAPPNGTTPILNAFSPPRHKEPATTYRQRPTKGTINPHVLFRETVQRGLVILTLKDMLVSGSKSPQGCLSRLRLSSQLGHVGSIVKIIRARIMGTRSLIGVSHGATPGPQIHLSELESAIKENRSCPIETFLHHSTCVQPVNSHQRIIIKLERHLRS